MAGQAGSLPTADDVMKELVGDKAGKVTLDTLTSTVVTGALKLIRAAQNVATPLAVLVFIVGIILVTVGVATQNMDLRRSGAKTSVVALVFIILVKMAPIIVAALEASVR